MIPKKQHLVISNVLLEFLILNLSIGVVFYLKNKEVFAINPEIPLSQSLTDLALLTTIFNVVWGFIILFNGDQNLYMNSQFSKRLKYLLVNIFLFIGINSTIFILFKLEYFNRITFLLPIFIFAALNLLLFNWFTQIQRQRQNSTISSAILAMGKESKLDHQRFIQKITDQGYDFVGYLLEENTRVEKFNSKILGTLEELSKILEKNTVDEIFLTASSMEEEKVNDIINLADYQGIRVNLVPDTPVSKGRFPGKAYEIDGLPVYPHRQTPLDEFNNFLIKRAFDLIFSFTVLLLLSPFMALIGFIIALDRKGPILYRPVRKGAGGRTFRCYKFRTMSVCDNPLNGTKSTVKDDPRITWIGKYLRKYDLDELPQFFNVLKGDMSVVGPRPHRINLHNDFRKIINDYMVRHYVKPGITGWAQVNGWRGPTQTIKQKEERIKHDIWFIENWSFFLDIKIIFLTVFGKETRRNAF